MSGYMVVMQWVMLALLLVLTVTVIRMSRFIKELAEMSAASAPLEADLLEQDHGWPEGAMFPWSEIKGLDGQISPLHNRRGSGTIVAFASAGCSSCDGMLAAIPTFLKKRSDIRFAVYVVGTPEEVHEKVSKFPLNIPIQAVTQEEADQTGTGIFPFGYFLDPAGRVVMKTVLGNESFMHVLTDKAMAAKLSKAG